MEYFDSFQRENPIFSLFGKNTGFETLAGFHGADGQDKLEKFYEFLTAYRQIWNTDKPITRKFLEIIALMTPLADNDNKRQLEIMAKIIEIWDTMAYYSTIMSEIDAEKNNPGWRRDMLMSVRPLLAEETQAGIDRIVCTMDFADSARQYFEMMTQ